jgi:hypothetical protein
MNSTRLFGSTLFIGLAILLTPIAGMAAITAITSNDTTNTFQQTENSPCIIGEASCKNGGFVQTSVSGNPPTIYDYLSPAYLAQNITAVAAPNLIPLSFKIGIDDNHDNDPEFLEFFKTWVCTGTAAFCAFSGSATDVPGPLNVNYSLDTPNSFGVPTAAHQNLSENNNGNGYSDITLNGFSLTAGRYYVFEAKVSGDSDGKEQFFLIPANTPSVPEPKQFIFTAAGAVLLFLMDYRRRRRNNLA